MSISVRDLLEAGAHFGHQTHRWNPKMRPFIYGARNGIHIINLQKTAQLWNDARKAVVHATANGQKVLFIGTKPQAQDVVQEEATRAGQYFVNRRWLGGMLTNFKTIKSRIDRLRDLDDIMTSAKVEAYSKKEALLLNKERAKLEKGLCGIKAMNKLPALVVVIDPKKEQIAIREARKLGIALLGIVDTNCDPDGIDYVIPANDDALKSIRIFLSALADACLEGSKVFDKRVQEEAKKRAEEEEKERQRAKAAQAQKEKEAAAAKAAAAKTEVKVEKEKDAVEVTTKGATKTTAAVKTEKKDAATQVAATTE